MYNDLLTIGPVTIHGYGVMICIGMLAAIFICDKRMNKRGMDSDYLFGMLSWVVVIGFICAKLLFIITEFKTFLASPLEFLGLSGFTVFGGIIGGAATIWVYCVIKKVKPLDYFDIIVIGVALAQGFGRIGCLLAGCCYGRPTSSAIGIVFKNSQFAPNGVKLIPTQIMMSIGDFAIAAILLIFANTFEKKMASKANFDNDEVNVVRDNANFDSSEVNADSDKANSDIDEVNVVRDNVNFDSSEVNVDSDKANSDIDEVNVARDKANYDIDEVNAASDKSEVDEKNTSDNEKSATETFPKTGGRITLLYLGLYSLGRFFIEFFRDDYRGNIGPLSTSQFIGVIVIVIVCILYFVLFKGKKKSHVNV